MGPLAIYIARLFAASSAGFLFGVYALNNFTVLIKIPPLKSTSFYQDLSIGMLFYQSFSQFFQQNIDDLFKNCKTLWITKGEKSEWFQGYRFGLTHQYSFLQLSLSMTS